MVLMKDQEIQEKYVLYQILGQTIDTLKQQLQLLENQKMEARMAEETLKDIGKLKPGNEIMVPVGSGCYARSSIIDTKSFMVSIGSGVLMGKSEAELGSFLGEKTKELDEAAANVQKELVKAHEKLNEISAEMQEFAVKHQPKPKA